MRTPLTPPPLLQQAAADVIQHAYKRHVLWEDWKEKQAELYVNRERGTPLYNCCCYDGRHYSYYYLYTTN